jgi:hypothetical protein
MNLAESIQEARKSGYSDAEIAAYIAKDPNMGSKVSQARKAGYSDAEIVSHLASPSLIEQTKDFGTQIFAGAKDAVTGFGDQLFQASPIGAIAKGANIGQRLAAPVIGLLTGQTPDTARVPMNPFAKATAPMDVQPRSVAGEYGRSFGRNVFNAAAPGSIPARIANVVAPAVASEVAAQAARRAGAGRIGEEVARTAGGIAGGAAASTRLSNPFRPEAGPAETLAARASQDPAAMQQRAQDFRDVGINPTLVDVVDDAGRGMVRAAANRPTPGRDAANQFARGRTLDLPARISTQARRNMSADTRTPDQIRAAMSARRSANADQAFGAVRGDAVDLGQDGLMTLRVPEVSAAIGEAARRERDPGVRAALEDLRTWAQGDASTGAAPPITVGMADRISRVLLSKARGMDADPDLRATLNMFGNAVRNPAREASPGYARALQGYEADTRLQDAAGVGEGLMTRNTDEFVQRAQALGPAERALALAAGRRAIERKAGENVSAAPGVARALAEAPEQQARNAALMGPQRAQQFQQGMRLEAQAVDNANQIAPRTGSPTHLNDADAARVAGALQTGARVGRQLVRQDWIGLGMDWLRSRGLSDQEAEALVRMATDPALTDTAIQLITHRLGPEGARPFIRMRDDGLIGATVTALTGGPRASAQGQPERER